MEVKERLNQVLFNLSNIEVKGENNVLILAQSFVDLRKVMNQIANQDVADTTEENE